MQLKKQIKNKNKQNQKKNKKIDWKKFIFPREFSRLRKNKFLTKNPSVEVL